MKRRENQTSMEGKTCIVTGASSGIGRVTARELARMGARVVLLCRNRSKGEQTVAEIREEIGHAALDLLLVDFESQAQTRQVAKEILAAYAGIHVLVNNAGITNLGFSKTGDGIETVFAVNHLAPFLLTNLLLERVLTTPSARIVNVASNAHRFGTIHWDDLGYEKKFRWMKVYGQSKLANILFTRELARRIAGSGVTANSLHPGGVATGLGSNNGLISKLVLPLARPFLRTPERGAETSIYLASSPEVEGLSGVYFANCKPHASSAEARDDQVAARLWTLSEELTGLA